MTIKYGLHHVCYSLNGINNRNISCLHIILDQLKPRYYVPSMKCIEQDIVYVT
jgi:hypothetical protein